jgi:hypothetical protein
MKNKLIVRIHSSIIVSWLSIFYVSLHPDRLLAQPSIDNPTVQQRTASSATYSPEIRHIRKALDKIIDYLEKYPNLKFYPAKTLIKEYPTGTSCPKIKQPPFFILLLAVGKVAEGDSNYMLGSAFGSAPDRTSIDKNSGASIERTLLQIATSSGLTEAIETDTKRPTADKRRPTLYQYRVEFDPKSCKVQSLVR